MAPPEPWNPFDTGGRENFPSLQFLELGSAGTATAPAPEHVSIEAISAWQPVDIDPRAPRQHGYLSLDVSQRLEAECQTWFDRQAELKASRVGCEHLLLS